MEADNVALERAYLAAKVGPGEPVLVSLEGRIAERPAVGGDATVLSLEPERFISVSAGASCAAATAMAELAATQWMLTHLGDARSSWPDRAIGRA